MDTELVPNFSLLPTMLQSTSLNTTPCTQIRGSPQGWYRSTLGPQILNFNRYSNLPSTGAVLTEIPIAVLKHFPPLCQRLIIRKKIASLMNEKWCRIGFLWHFPEYQWGSFHLFLHFFLDLNFPQETRATFIILKGVFFSSYFSSFLSSLLKQT